MLEPKYTPVYWVIVPMVPELLIFGSLLKSDPNHPVTRSRVPSRTKHGCVVSDPASVYPDSKSIFDGNNREVYFFLWSIAKFWLSSRLSLAEAE